MQNNQGNDKACIRTKWYQYPIAENIAEYRLIKKADYTGKVQGQSMHKNQALSPGEIYPLISFFSHINSQEVIKSTIKFIQIVYSPFPPHITPKPICSTYPQSEKINLN